MEWDSSSSLANPQVWGFEGGGGGGGREIPLSGEVEGLLLLLILLPFLLQTVIVSGITERGLTSWGYGGEDKQSRVEMALSQVSGIVREMGSYLFEI